jgi:HD-GYP domain-containing protein (c-di-GMP phosphodiesterase class II)
VLIIETAKTIYSCCRKNDILARTGGDEFSILLPKTNKQTALEILNKIQAACSKYNKKYANETSHISLSLGCCTKETADENFEQVCKMAEEAMYQRKLLERKSSRSAIISSIKATMLEKSNETEAHAGRLVFLSRVIGSELGLLQSELDNLELFATLHDIGKVGVNNHILKKPGTLSKDEWDEMKQHSIIGYRIALSAPELVPIADYILSHHERWDGKGYPQGLKGVEIPLHSRILAIVDAYDAMTEDRVYRKALSKEAAISEIKVKNSIDNSTACTLC